MGRQHQARLEQHLVLLSGVILGACGVRVSSAIAGCTIAWLIPIVIEWVLKRRRTRGAAR